MRARIWIHRLIGLLMLGAMLYPAFRVHESRADCERPGWGYKPQPGDC